MKRLMILAVTAVTLAATPANAWKDIAHFVSLPLIEGSGAYCGINILNKAQNNSTKAAAIADLSCLGINAALGITTMLGPADAEPTLRRIHKTMGFVTTAAALWMAIAASSDPEINGNKNNAAIKYVSYGHTALTVVPIIIFSF